MSELIALGLPTAIFALVFLLSFLLPANRFEGYIVDIDTGKPVVYSLNALPVCLIVLSIFVTGGYLDWYQLDWLYQFRWEMLTGACVVGLLYSGWLVFTEPSGGRPVLVEFFLGRCQNLVYFNRVDAKMYLYMAGAILLALNVLSYAFAHYQMLGEQANPGVAIQAVLLLFFVFDYLTFERVHVYTYDIFAENLGFKLAWGCFVFYPFFYAIGLWSTASLPVSEINAQSNVWLICCVSVFLLGWGLARGANMQKYYFKRFPEQAFLGIKPAILSDQQGMLLSSGFWGLSRHINYLGEILMALAIAGSLGHFDVLWPWLYPIYYVLLLGTRERDDDRRCATKYGALWDEYRNRVPYRIFPGIY